MNEMLVTVAPLVLGGLFLFYLARQGRTGLAISGSLFIIIGTWLLAQVFIPGYVTCPQGRCSLLAHLDQLWTSRWLFMQLVAPVFVAALASQPLLHKGRPLPGIATGLGVIGIYWAIRVTPMFTCQGETVECEWVWAGILLFNLVALFQAAAVVLIDLAIFVRDQRKLDQAAQRIAQPG